ncbi:MAG: DUF3078 domain-containing protein [Bacteroidia bacterium]|nr:DUF3078 domain-containing protein [Bacteroidia bacterium]
MRYYIALLLITGACQGVWAAPADTAWIRVFTKSHRHPLPALTVVYPGDTVTVSPQRAVPVAGLKPGEHPVTVTGSGFRVASVKLEAKHFGKDTLRIEMVPYWTLDGSGSFSISQNALGTYWQAGGADAIAARAEGILHPMYQRGAYTWDTRCKITYGIIRQNGQRPLKNEDLVDLTSQLGYRVTERLRLTSLLNFRTPMYATYTLTREGSRGNLIARFLAPGALNLGTGLDFQYKKAGMSVYYSPLNTKITLVRDSLLRMTYLPPAFADRSTRYELGSYLNFRYNKEVLKNITLQTRADFFTNHLQHFGSVDVNWETGITCKVNKYVSANVLTHVIYDDDIMFLITDRQGQPETHPDGTLTGRRGPRTQFRQALNIGVAHKF